MSRLGPYNLFERFGVELEYMIVDRDTLDVRPIADELFRAATGRDTCDVEPEGPDGVIGYSNELALHVAELKTLHPQPTLDGLAARFHEHTCQINALLAPFNARLLPGAMHPWMDPDTQTRLWPHENNEVYAAFDRIFGCRGHGWGNLQSTHLNLPFADAEQFGRLHAAIRLVLPLIPALAASSPIVEGRVSAFADHRMELYRTNSRNVPMMTGLVVPEPVFTPEAYHREVLGRLYDDLRPHDPQGILQEEWANARGCIARFGRGSIEVRVIDIQECPAADLAIVALLVAVIRALVEERWSSYEQQQAVPTEPLHRVLLDCTRLAEDATVTEPGVLRALGLSAKRTAAHDLWKTLLERTLPDDAEHSGRLRWLLDHGTLSTRITKVTGPEPSRDTLKQTYAALADCLAAGSMFVVE